MDEHRGIGYRNRLPWHISSDLKRFKALTMGHHILMGRKTHETIGIPLQGRMMVVISRQKDYQARECLIVRSLAHGLEIARDRGESEAFVIGGGEIFAQALSISNRIYQTLVHTIAECDVFFPEIDEAHWKTSSEVQLPASDKDDYSSTFKILERRVADA
jgi:dihydrofolate reductase